jgi:predicted dehydrogenase
MGRVLSSAVHFGVVGCGRIGSSGDDRAREWPTAHLWLPYSHCSAITATAGATLAAVCDVDPAALAAARLRHAPGACYGDLEKMLSTESLDVLAIATRTHERGGIIRCALQSGVRGLYCEKPLSNSLEDADALTELIERRGVAFVYGTKRRFMPAFHGVRERIRAGEIGEVTTITVRFGFGSLLWSSPHAVDVAMFFANDAHVERVQADLAMDRSDLEDSVVDADPVLQSATIHFAGGVRAILLAGEGYDVQVIGRDGLVTMDADGYRVRWRKRLRGGADFGWLLDESLDPPAAASSGTQLSIASLVRSARDGSHPGYDIRMALRNQEILFAMMESEIAGGRAVAFPVPRRGLVITGRTGSLYA